MKIFKLFNFIVFCGHGLFASEHLPHIHEKETPIVKYLKRIEVTEKISGLKGIDCIYLINLDSRPDRWKRVKKLLDEKELNVNRISAINGWELSKEALKELSGPYPVRLKGGEYGCLLSHVSILKDAYKRGYKCIWILEDDIEFLDNPQTIPSILKTLTKLDRDWDVFYTDANFRNLDGTYLKSYSYSQRPDQPLFPFKYYQLRFKLNDDIIQIRSRWGTTSMIFSERGIKKALDFFTHVYIWSPIDHDIHTIPGIHEYASQKDIISNRTQSIDSNTKSPTLQVKFPENPNQSLFEQAQTYQNNHEYDKAIELYQQRASFEDRSPEAFWSYYQIGRLQEEMKLNSSIFLKTYFDAHISAPLRAEPLFRIAQHYRNKGNYMLGYFFAKQALALPHPSDISLIEDWIYDYGLLMELSLDAYYLEKYHESKELSEQMLKNQALPINYINAALDILKWVDKQITDQ